MEQEKVIKVFSKKEISSGLGITGKTLALYCNSMYFEGLKRLGYHVNQKNLTPAQVNFLKEKLGF